MARELRIEFLGPYYHISTRGNEGKNIFKTDEYTQELFGLYSLKSGTGRHS